jgi:hypothetical protein
MMGGACSTHGEVRNSYKYLAGSPQRKKNLGDLGVYGRVILKWILEKQDVRVRTGLNWLSMGFSSGLL